MYFVKHSLVPFTLQNNKFYLQMNVSQAEYAKMLKIYKQSVKQSKLLSKLQQVTSDLDRSITDHLPKTFNFHPTGNFEAKLLLIFLIFFSILKQLLLQK